MAARTPSAVRPAEPARRIAGAESFKGLPSGARQRTPVPGTGRQSHCAAFPRSSPSLEMAASGRGPCRRAVTVCHGQGRGSSWCPVRGGNELTSGSEPVGSLDVALNHTARLLAQQPALAAEQAAEILKVVPGHPVATLLLGAARRACGDPAAALQILAPLAAAQARSPVTQYEYGLALGDAGQGEPAIAAL